mmetsp:Transcript_74332/g.188649  ORF Transcript_74332/g.188649 Transcript_74332/m.188649 type:complete len:239 (-) Transcript_74332:373-1089(-)
MHGGVRFLPRDANLHEKPTIRYRLPLLVPQRYPAQSPADALYRICRRRHKLADAGAHGGARAAAEVCPTVWLALLAPRSALIRFVVHLESDEGHVVLLDLELEHLEPLRAESIVADTHGLASPGVRVLSMDRHHHQRIDVLQMLLALRLRQEVSADDGDGQDRRTHLLLGLSPEHGGGLEDVAAAAVLLAEHPLMQDHAYVRGLVIQRDQLSTVSPMQQWGNVLGVHVRRRRVDPRQL